MDEVPDFSHDDYANDKEILAQRAKLKAELNIINEGCKVLSESLPLAAIDDKFPDNFGMLSEAALFDDVDLKDNAFESTNASMPLKIFLVANYFYQSTGRSSHISGYDNYIVGVLQLKKQYPRTAARPKTFADKLTNMLTHAEVDFNDAPKFNSHYQVMSADKEKLLLLLHHQYIDALAECQELQLEIIDNACMYIVSTKGINKESAELFVSLTKTINKVLNGLM